MPDTAHLLAFLSAAVVLAVLPGPGMLYVLARSLAGGTRAGLRSTMGTAIGGLGHVAAASIGLSTLLLASAVAFDTLRLAGAAYLVLLGVQTLLSLRASDSDLAPRKGAATKGAVRQGIVTELLNPKTGLFFLTFLPQFIQPSRGSVPLQLAVLGTATVLLNSCSDTMIAAGAGRLGRLLEQRPRILRRQRAASGCVLVALGGYTAVSGR